MKFSYSIVLLNHKVVEFEFAAIRFEATLVYLY